VAQNRLGGSLKIESTSLERKNLDTAPAPGQTALEFLLLGTLEVRRSGKPLQLGGLRQRALIALLCLRPGAVLTVDELADRLWGEHPPTSVRHMVEVYVSKLRKVVGPGVLITRPPGYVLEADPNCLDVTRFELFLTRGREALSQGELETAVAELKQGLDLWRGPALADFTYESFAQAEIARLDDLRRLAEDEWIEAQLLLGRAEGLVGSIEALVVAEPLRERRHAQLMRALWRAGRQADALAAYRRARETLVGELGIEPGPDLHAVHAAILNQDETVLAVPPTAQPGVPSRTLERTKRPGSSRKRARGLLAVLFISAAAAVSISVLAIVRGQGPAGSPAPAVEVVPNSVALIDPTRAEVVGDVPVGRTPGPVVFGNGAAWVGNFEDKTISRIDAQTKAVITLGIDVRPYGLAIGEGALWVTNSGTGDTSATLTRRDLISDRIDSIELGPGHPFRGDLDPRGAPSLVGRAMPVVVHDGVVWAGRRYYSQVVRIDASNAEPVKRIRGPDPAGLAAAHGNVWVVNLYDNTVWRVEASSGRVEAKVQVGETPCCVVATESAIWVASGRTQVWRISPRSNSVEATVDVGRNPVAIAAGEGAIWVANYGDSSVSRIDAQTNHVTTLPLQRRPVDIAVGGGAVWVSLN